MASALSSRQGYDYSYTQYGDVGSYTITPKGLTSDNYEISFVAGTLTVEQKTVGLTWGSTELVFTGTAQVPTAEATGLVEGDAGKVSVTVTGQQTNVGEGYTATASALTGDKAGNYKLPAANTTTFKIIKADLTPTVTMEGWTYGKTANTPAITGNLGGGVVSCEYYTDEACTTKTTAENSGAASEGAVPVNAGNYYVKVSIAATDNTNAWATATPVKFTIAKAAITVTADNKTGKYGENLAKLTYQISGDYKTGDDLGITLSTTASRTTNVGKYPITVTWTENTNYSATLKNGEYTITKTTMDKSDLTDAQKPAARTGLGHDGTDQALVTAPSALPAGYTIQYSKDGGKTWTDTIPTGNEAGTYTVQVRYVGDGNHEGFASDPISVTIRERYTVRFNINGGTAVEAQSVLDGERVIKPVDPTKENNIFDAWYEDATFVKVFDFSTVITADITLYAKWLPIGYEVISVEGATSDATHTWTKGSTQDAVITVKPSAGVDDSFSRFVSLQLDGRTLVRDTDYTVHAGSTVATFKPAFLETLSVGTHTVTFNFNNGKTETKLTIKVNTGGGTGGGGTGGGTGTIIWPWPVTTPPGPGSIYSTTYPYSYKGIPQTGDTSELGLWSTIMFLSGADLLISAIGRKRRKAINREK